MLGNTPHIEVRPTLERRDLLDINVDGELWRQVHTSIFGRRPTLPTGDDWQQQFEVLEYKNAKSFALRQLARKSQTSMELAQSMHQRLVPEAVITRVVEEISSQGYIDDTDWVHRYVKGQIAKGKGPAAIKASLRAKRIPEGLIDQELKDCHAADSQTEEIRRLLATRYKSRNIADFKERQKVVGALARRGFDFDHIRQVLDS